MYQQLAITADDIAQVIAFAVTLPRRTTLMRSSSAQPLRRKPAPQKKPG